MKKFVGKCKDEKHFFLSENWCLRCHNDADIIYFMCRKTGVKTFEQNAATISESEDEVWQSSDFENVDNMHQISNMHQPKETKHATLALLQQSSARQKERSRAKDLQIEVDSIDSR